MTEEETMKALQASREKYTASKEVALEYLLLHGLVFLNEEGEMVSDIFVEAEGENPYETVRI